MGTKTAMLRWIQTYGIICFAITPKKLKKFLSILPFFQ